MPSVMAACWMSLYSGPIFTPRARSEEISIRRRYTCILRTDRRPTNDQPHIWENFKRPYLREGSSDPLRVWFYGGVFGVGGSNGANSGSNKFNRYVGENNARGVIRLVTIYSISCYKYTSPSNMWQSLVTIDRTTLDITRRNKKKKI